MSYTPQSRVTGKPPRCSICGRVLKANHNLTGCYRPTRKPRDRAVGLEFERVTGLSVPPRSNRKDLQTVILGFQHPDERDLARIARLPANSDVRRRWEAYQAATAPLHQGTANPLDYASDCCNELRCGDVCAACGKACNWTVVRGLAASPVVTPAR
jgi:hypothetical protein